MITIDPKQVTQQILHAWLLSAVTPRPIALVSSTDKSGNINLSPFSFFNCFGSNPPVLVFSPSRRVRDNTTKHTLENVLEVPEVVVHIVSYSIVQQTSLSSTEYSKGVNEFVKAGFTAEPSQVVKPPRVKEAPVAMECRVLQVLPVGEGPGSANLVICEVLLMHISESVAGDNGQIDPVKLEAVARLGGDWYSRVDAGSLFTVPKPLQKKGIGVDQLPERIRRSPVLTGNDLARLANVEAIPFEDERTHDEYDELQIHESARLALAEGKLIEAWRLLLKKQKA